MLLHFQSLRWHAILSSGRFIYAWDLPSLESARVYRQDDQRQRLAADLPFQTGCLWSFQGEIGTIPLSKTNIEDMKVWKPMSAHVFNGFGGGIFCSFVRSRTSDGTIHSNYAPSRRSDPVWIVVRPTSYCWPFGQRKATSSRTVSCVRSGTTWNMPLSRRITCWKNGVFGCCFLAFQIISNPFLWDF